MRRIKKKIIFVVDDERPILEEIREILEDASYKVCCFISAKDCLKKLEQSNGISCDLLIADQKMPKMKGLELLKRCQQLYGWMPVIIITGFGTKEMAFKAGKTGAIDFVDKPFTRKDLLSKVKSVLKQDIWDNLRKGKRPLTQKQVKILRLLLHGLTNKKIAKIHGLAESTIEDHRNNIYKKIGVHNTAELFKWAYEIGLLP